MSTRTSRHNSSAATLAADRERAARSAVQRADDLAEIARTLRLVVVPLRGCFDVARSLHTSEAWQGPAAERSRDALELVALINARSVSGIDDLAHRLDIRAAALNAEASVLLRSARGLMASAGT